MNPRQFSKEEVLSAYNAAPDEVRSAFNASSTTTVIESIGATYHLHADVIGALHTSVGYMLLGLLSPTEFFGQMVLSGFDQNDARAVLDALNSRIFMPLQTRMRNARISGEEANPDYIPYAMREGDEGAEESEHNTAIESRLENPRIPVAAIGGMSQQNIPPPEITLSHRTPSAARPSQPSPTPINLMDSAYSAPREGGLPQQPTTQQSYPKTDPVEQGTLHGSSQLGRPVVRTMQQDMARVQHPETAGMAIAPETARPAGGMRYSPHPDHATPARVFQTGSIPIAMPVQTHTREGGATAVTPHPYASDAYTPPPAVSNEPILPGSVPAAPVPRPVPVNIDPATHTYSVDPYREPV